MDINKSINADELPYPDDDDDVIGADIAPQNQQPVPPGEAVRLEEERYGESSLDENRDDQFDAHHADSDEHL